MTPRNVPEVALQYLPAPLHIRRRHHHMAVKAARPHQGLRTKQDEKVPVMSCSWLHTSYQLYEAFDHSKQYSTNTMATPCAAFMLATKNQMPKAGQPAVHSKMCQRDYLVKNFRKVGGSHHNDTFTGLQSNNERLVSRSVTCQPGKTVFTCFTACKLLRINKQSKAIHIRITEGHVMGSA